MIVVGDSSPLILLINIGHIALLPSLFKTVTIPPEVAGELGKHGRPQKVREFISQMPAWLTVKAPSKLENIPSLDAGEIAAISLASELKADLLLIDEDKGRKAAAERKINFTGTIGISERAAELKLLDLKDAFERVKKTDFWISHKLLAERLKAFEQRTMSQNPAP